VWLVVAVAIDLSLFFPPVSQIKNTPEAKKKLRWSSPSKSQFHQTQSKPAEDGKRDGKKKQESKTQNGRNRDTRLVPGLGMEDEVQKVCGQKNDVFFVLSSILN